MTERIRAADLKRVLAKPKNKYGAEKTTVHGIKFDSKREAKRYAELLALQKAGVIAELRLQVPLMLEGRSGPLRTRTGRQMRITVDFQYVELCTGLTIWEDAKGSPTRDYEVRRAVAAAQGVEVREV
ncbi:hypothetical protein GCM10007385_35320 [Tateyamaria omphalii]|uniref:DUF1064 domain-containing protein n=1 Tax=Tateyamaria omphalii TaxID=299262 RepID=UPI00167BAF54|nr:DUF1064 domain-containing protein [Tateyamaria omphalii]GGX63126.1 hypothetical protein GCM10007385_35320 [Tateyamaria omphalii]